MNFKNKLLKYHEKFKDEPEKMEKLFMLFEELITVDIKEENNELYEDFMMEFEDHVDFIDEEEIITAITYLKKKDGSPGNKWTKDEVEAVVKQFNIEERLGEKYCKHKFWFAMNYAYAVHCAPNKTLSNYVEMAIDEMMDANVPIKCKIRIMNEENE
jgi:hypothetical protein